MLMSNITKTIKAILSRIAVTGLARRILANCTNGIVTVFLLHRPATVNEAIHGHDPEDIVRIITLLKKYKFNLVSLQQVVEAAQGKRVLPYGSIAFSIDDGYKDQLEIIAPIFLENEVPVTVFLTTGLVNKELWSWDAKIHWLLHKTRLTSIEIEMGFHRLEWPLTGNMERLVTRRELQSICAALPGEKIDWFLRLLEKSTEIQLPECPPPEFSPASWDMVRKLESSGVRFAPHTHSHRILRGLSDTEVFSEISRSMGLLKKETRHWLPILAYPVGMESHFGAREMYLAERSGCSAAFAVCENYSRWGKSHLPIKDLYCLKRFGLPSSIHEAIWIASGMQEIVSLMLKRRKYNKLNNVMRKGSKTYLRNLWIKMKYKLGCYDYLKDIDIHRVKRLVFVCSGNVCRSPYAEAVTKSKNLPAISCGVEVYRSAPAEPMAVRAAILRGKDISRHVSRSIYDVSIVDSDLLIAMDPSHLNISHKVAHNVGCQATLISLWHESPLSGIADPYGGQLDEFNACFDEIDNSLFRLMGYLKK